VGQVSRKSYRETLKAVLENIELEPFPRLILNFKDLDNQPDLGRLWFTLYFLPKYYKTCGRIYVAMLTKTHRFERKSIPWLSNLIGWLGIKITVRFFHQLNDAQQWIQTQGDEDEDEELEEDFNHSSPNFLFNDYLKDNEFNWEDEQASKPQKTKSKKKSLLSKQKGKFKFRIVFDPKGKLK
jgi:hypothetical protein